MAKWNFIVAETKQKKKTKQQKINEALKVHLRSLIAVTQQWVREPAELMTNGQEDYVQAPCRSSNTARKSLFSLPQKCATDEQDYLLIPMLSKAAAGWYESFCQATDSDPPSWIKTDWNFRWILMEQEWREVCRSRVLPAWPHTSINSTVKVTGLADTVTPLGMNKMFKPHLTSMPRPNGWVGYGNANPTMTTPKFPTHLHWFFIQCVVWVLQNPKPNTTLHRKTQPQP